MTNETNFIIATMTKPATTVAAIGSGLIATIASYLGAINPFLGFITILFGAGCAVLHFSLYLKKIKKANREEKRERRLYPEDFE